MLDDERKDTCAGFWTRAVAWFADHGITVTAAMTDNAKAYWSEAFTDALVSSGTRRWAIPRYRPQLNGKVDCFNRTLADEWASPRCETAMPNGPRRWTAGCISTTITAATPLSGRHPSPA